MKHLPLLSLALLLLLPFVGGCQNKPTGLLPIERVQIGNRDYKLEIARAPSDREHGLMERDTLDRDAGMLFVFDESEIRDFWMFHTRFDLDILYLDPAGTVVSIKTMKAYDKTTVSSDYPAQYAIELSQGEADHSGVKVGQHIKLPASVLSDKK